MINYMQLHSFQQVVVSFNTFSCLFILFDGITISKEEKMILNWGRYSHIKEQPHLLLELLEKKVQILLRLFDGMHNTNNA